MADRSKMKAAVLVQPRTFEIREVDRPEPGAGQVRVQIEGCGVCASNIPPFEGREWFQYPMEPGQLGHEAWGIVDAVGEGVDSPKIGDRVAMLSNHAYAEYDVADAEACVSLPAELDGKAFPAEPLGCAINIFKRACVKQGDRVGIVGIGFLGALLISLCKSVGAHVTAIGRRESTLELAKSLGADATIAMDDHWRIIEAVKQATDEQMFNVTFECVGKEWPLNLAAELTGVRGRLIVAGYHQDGMRSVNMQLWNWRGLDVINAHEREMAIYYQGMRDAIEATKKGAFDPYPLITHELPLESLGEALEMTISRPDGFQKAIITVRRPAENANSA